jgi:hypothetical protein
MEFRKQMPSNYLKTSSKVLISFVFDLTSINKSIHVLETQSFTLCNARVVRFHRWWHSCRIHLTVWFRQRNWYNLNLFWIESNKLLNTCCWDIVGSNEWNFTFNFTSTDSLNCICFLLMKIQRFAENLNLKRNTIDVGIGSTLSRHELHWPTMTYLKATQRRIGHLQLKWKSFPDSVQRLCSFRLWVNNWSEIWRSQLLISCSI